MTTVSLKERMEVIITTRRYLINCNPFCDLNLFLSLFLSHTFFLIAIETFIQFLFLHISDFLTRTGDVVHHEGIVDVVVMKAISDVVLLLK